MFYDKVIKTRYEVEYAQNPQAFDVRPEEIRGRRVDYAKIETYDTETIPPQKREAYKFYAALRAQAHRLGEPGIFFFNFEFNSNKLFFLNVFIFFL
jgi:hypothetical protein